MAKYKLTKNIKELGGRTLFQIEATTSFGLVSKGELGGYIENEENLSQSGNAWVSGNAQVYDKLRLTRGYFFGYKEKTEELKYFSLRDDSNYELVGKGDCQVEESDGKKTELLKKAQELIDKAQELKEEAEKM